jgi:pyrroline-5-carboxylate reductase
MSGALINRIGFIGAGKMGSAIIKGLLAKGHNPSDIFVSDIIPSQVEIARSTLKVTPCKTNQDVVAKSQAIIVGVKPKDFAHVLGEIKPAVKPSVPVISIAGGLTIAELEGWLNQDSHVIRTCPSICAEVLESLTAIASGTNATTSDMNIAKSIFDCVGKTFDLKESQFEAFTGVAGCGPAFIFPVIAALADGAVYEGLDRKLALKAAAQMLIGAGKLAAKSDAHPDELKDSVCSPGGSTIRGVKVLEEHGIRGAFMNAVIAAANRWGNK